MATGQHPMAEAADFIPLDAGIEVYHWIVTDSGLIWGQAIKEIESDGKVRKEWIHFSLPRLNKPNRQALVYTDGQYHPYNSVVKSRVL